MIPIAWFKVDDSLAFHAKVLAAGNAAMGLWVRAGSWSAQQLEDGVVPSHVARVMGGEEEIAALVREGLWHEVEGGYVFHQWEERQPSRADVLARREAEAEKKRRAREAAVARREAESRRESLGESPDVSPGESRGDMGRESRGESGLPDPTRPDPTLTHASTKHEGARAKRTPTKRGTRIPEPFMLTREMREWAAEEVPGVDADRSTRMFVDYWRGVPGVKGTKLDWLATWKNWLRRDHERLPSAKVSPAARAAQLALAIEAAENDEGRRAIGA